MYVYRNFSIISEDLVATIGNFDGIHTGHQKLINEIIKISTEKKLVPAIITFEPHPSKYFQKIHNSFNIFPLKTKLKLFRDLGIKKCFIIKFNENIVSAGANEFFYKIIYNNLNIKHLVVGHDFRFGNKREGGVELLQSLSIKNGIGFTKINEIFINNHNCSSSSIRSAIEGGQIEKANMLLGRIFFIEGKVITGSNIAGKLGFPTANINIGNIIKPKYGVYLVNAIIDNVRYNAIANLGVRPTMDIKKELLEVHIFDYDHDLYGKKIRIELTKFLRDERKFISISELENQIKDDIIEARKYYKKT